MLEIDYLGRRAVALENHDLRVTVLCEGGHIASILDKRTGVNPLWTPIWPSIEPSTYTGDAVDGKLLAGIMGHNVCLDYFGPPTPEEFAAGLPVHGEVGVVEHEITIAGAVLTQRALLPLAQIRFERHIRLNGSTVHIQESVENLTACDRPLGWTQHATLGPPFLERGVTEFRVSAAKSKAFESTFGSDDYMPPGAEFDWPMAPKLGGGVEDLRVFNSAPVSSAFSAHLMDPRRESSFFAAYSPTLELGIAYIWKRADFPWLGRWEENHSRSGGPWEGRSVTCGMEFGVSPFPEPRRAMIERGSLFGVPTYRWLPARGRIEVEYKVIVRGDLWQHDFLV